METVNDNDFVFALTFSALDLWSGLSGVLVYLGKLFRLGAFVRVLLNARPCLSATCYSLKKQPLVFVPVSPSFNKQTVKHYKVSVPPSLPVIVPSVCALTVALQRHFLINSKKQKWQLHSRSATCKNETCIRNNKYGSESTPHSLSLVAAKHGNHRRWAVMVMA